MAMSYLSAVDQMLVCELIILCETLLAAKTRHRPKPVSDILREERTLWRHRFSGVRGE